MADYRPDAMLLSFEDLLRRYNMNSPQTPSQGAQGPIVDNPNSPTPRLNTSVLDALTAQNAADPRSVVGGVNDMSQPLLKKLGPIGGGLSKGVDFLEGVGDHFRGAAERGVLGGIAPRFQAGVNAAQERAMNEMLAKSQLALNEQQLAAGNQQNPFAGIPSGTLERFDPASVVAAVQSGDLSQLRAMGPDADNINKLVNELADDVRAESKTFEQASTAYAKIEQGAMNPSAFGDLALIFNYMKVLDPGSTVREGEFANAAASGSLPDQVQALADQVLRGTRLSPPQRADLFRSAKRLYNAEAGKQIERNERFRQRGANAKVPSAFIDPILPQASLLDVEPNPDEPVNTDTPSVTYRYDSQGNRIND